jgi:hypothetical protein
MERFRCSWPGAAKARGKKQFNGGKPMALQIVPLDSSPNQNFDVTLDIDNKNVTLNLTIRYNEIAAYWVMDIRDSSTKADILSSIPLLPANYPTANILGQFAYMEIGSAYILKLGNSALDRPDANTLGTEFILVWGDTPSR